MRNKTFRKRPSAADLIECKKSPLQEKVAQIETGIASGVDAVNIELSQLFKLFELLLRQTHTSPALPRHQFLTSAHGDDRVRTKRGILKATGQVRERKSKRCRNMRERASPRKPRLDHELHHLHAFLRGVSGGNVDRPGRVDNAPGYYAVYFTDKETGLEVEYVHTSNRGGES